VERDDKGGRGWLHRKCFFQIVSFAHFNGLVQGPGKSTGDHVFYAFYSQIGWVRPAINFSTNSGNIPVTRYLEHAMNIVKIRSIYTYIIIHIYIYTATAFFSVNM